MATQQSDRSSAGKELVPAATSAPWRSTQAAMAGLTGNTHFRIIKKKKNQSSFVCSNNEDSFLMDACLEVEFPGVQ